MNKNDPHNLDEIDNRKKVRQKNAVLKEEQEVIDYRWLMNEKQGRRIIWKLLTDAGVFHSSFNTNNAVMSFNEGRRDYGLKVLAIMQAKCLKEYMIMVNENA
jgi:hypothetical protein